MFRLKGSITTTALGILIGCVATYLFVHSKDNVHVIRPADNLLVEANNAFQQQRDEDGVAFLSAALVADPANGTALDLYQKRVQERLSQIMASEKWEDAKNHIAGFDAVMRNAMGSAKSVQLVKEIMERRKKVTEWEKSLEEKYNSSVCKEMDQVLIHLNKSELDQHSELDSQLSKIQLESLNSDSRMKVSNVSKRVADIKKSNTIKGIENELKKLEAEAKQSDVSAPLLREISLRGNRLRTQIVEAGLQGVDLVNQQAHVEEILSQLEQRLQIQSIRQMQQIADADAIKVLNRVDAIISEIDKEYNKPTTKYQWCGEKVAEAESLLNRVDRLCSEQVQTECRKRQEFIRKRAIEYRIGQQMNYNLWAIDVLEKAMAEYDSATPTLWSNDRPKLKEIISDKIGEIDQQYLHPVTHALFAEMYQKILSALKENALKTEVTRNVELKKKKPLSDF